MQQKASQPCPPNQLKKLCTIHHYLDLKGGDDFGKGGDSDRCGLGIGVRPQGSVCMKPRE